MLDRKRAEYYAKVFERVRNKGKGYVTREMARLDKMRGSLPAGDRKTRWMEERRNILSTLL